METGLTSTIGFDYTIKNNKDFDFSVAQIVSEKEQKMHAKTSMDEKLSDLWVLPITKLMII